jgi:hypothetical protein
MVPSGVGARLAGMFVCIKAQNTNRTCRFSDYRSKISLKLLVKTLRYAVLLHEQLKKAIHEIEKNSNQAEIY